MHASPAPHCVYWRRGEETCHHGLLSGMPYQCTGSQCTIVCWQHREEQGHQDLWIWCALSMHRASAQHCMCWTHGEEQCHQELWMCLQYPCTGPKHSILFVADLAKKNCHLGLGWVCHGNAWAPSTATCLVKIAKSMQCQKS